MPDLSRERYRAPIARAINAAARRAAITCTPGVTEPPSRKRVEVRFVGQPPITRVGNAQGVTDVEVDGRDLRCFVSGSFQALLEAVSGYEVIDLNSVPVENERCSESWRTSM